MQLRPYQQEAIVEVWETLKTNKTALLVLPTGTGKTVIFQELVKKSLAAKPDIKILILFNRVKLLVDQVKRFPDLPLHTGVYCATEGKYDLDKPITIASIKSIKNTDQSFNFIICDEVHNASNEKGDFFDFFQKQISMNEKCKILGVTATPYRKDGMIFGKKKLFEKVCYQKSIQYFVQEGYLVQPIAKQPDFTIDVSKLRVKRGEYLQEDIDEQTLNVAMATDQVIDALNRSQDRKKIVWFCSSIKHAELIRDILISEGEKAVTVHSNLAWNVRERNHHAFEKMDTRHLTFVSVVSEGYDYPPIDCIVLMRPTRSTVMMMQTVGRGLRPSLGKENCLVLDYASVISTLGPLSDPLIPKKLSQKGAKVEPRTKPCPQCRAILAPRTMECFSCGFKWPASEATKIGLNADENVLFFSKAPKVMHVSSIKLDVHISKNGNRCIKITYVPKGIMDQQICEYFTVDIDYGYKKFTLRAMEIGLPLKQDINEQILEKPTRIPKSVEYIVEGKYERLKRLLF